MIKPSFSHTETCPALSDPADGSVSFSQTPLAVSGHYLPGTVASFSCGLGFVIVGDSTSVCQSDTTWTNSQPDCHRESRPHSCLQKVLADSYEQCKLYYFREVV